MIHLFVQLESLSIMSFNVNPIADLSSSTIKNLPVVDCIVLAEDGSSWSEAKNEIILKTSIDFALKDEYLKQVEELGLKVANETKSQGADALLGRDSEVRPITYSKVATDENKK